MLFTFLINDFFFLKHITLLYSYLFKHLFLL